MKLRVVTYNIHKGRGMDARVSTERIVEVLREVNANIIALQEVMGKQAEDISGALGMPFIIGENRRHRGDSYGNVLLTHFPHRSWRNYDLSVTGREQRGCLRADLRVESGHALLHVFNVHLGTSYLERRHQGRSLIAHDLLADVALEHPRIVLGDFNVIAVSLRHFFPEHWDGAGDDYRMAQHIADVIAFIEQINPKPVDLLGHSRGGHIAFRVAQQRPDLLRKLVLAEPGGDLDSTLDPAAVRGGPSPRSARVLVSVNKVRSGDIDGALENFVDGIDGEGTWRRLPAAAKQQLRDNITTLVGQVDEARKPYSKPDTLAIQTPTLLIGGADTKGSLSVIWRALAEHIAGAKTAVIPKAKHWMFEQDPEGFSRVVTEFLAE